MQSAEQSVEWQLNADVKFVEVRILGAHRIEAHFVNDRLYLKCVAREQSHTPLWVVQAGRTGDELFHVASELTAHRLRSLQLIRPHLQVEPQRLPSIRVDTQRDFVLASDRAERFIQDLNNVHRSRVPTEFLGKAEVHLWVVPLIISPEKFSYFKSILSLDEQERAGRFRKIGDAQRYIAARGSLRSLLGTYLTIKPDRLQFAYDAFGKPRLAGEGPLASMRFSVSHSEDLALFGFARRHKNGVDVERIRPDIDVEDLAARYFSPSEFQKLRALPADQQREAFYCGWTRKEAYLKARGEGLFFPLDRVEVSLTPGEPAMILKAFGDGGVSRRWIVQHLSPAPGYIGAAAVEGRDIAFRCFRCEPVL